MTQESSITDAGTWPNVIAKVDDVDVNTDVETAVGNYLVTIANGTLTVDPKAVTITAGSDSKTYDGTALTNYSFTATALESGDTHTFTVEMSQESTITDAGTQPNVIATVDGVAVNTGVETAIGNYLVTTVDGTLTVKPVIVKVSVVDKADKQQPIVGNLVVVRNSNGVIIHEWYSTTENHIIEGIKAGGEYTIMGNAYMGYTRSADYTLTIDENGNVSSYSGTTTEDGVLLVESGQTHVEISVVDIANANGAALVGAHVQVIEKTGEFIENVVEEWTSGTENYTIEGLPTGVTYTLRETVAPEGYVLPTDDITFTINEEGKVFTNGQEVAVLQVENAMTHVEISVVDIATRDEIEGAHVQVLAPGNNVVEEWTSGTEIHVIEGLKTGETYTLRETVAPEGYALPTDLTFTIIPETGQVTTTYSDNILNGVLLVENSKTLVNISVVDITTKAPISDATIKVLAPGNVVVEEWTSGTGNYVIEGLKTNVEYTLRETVAPEGYIIPSDITFTIENTGKITTAGTISEDGVLLVENSKTRVEISVIDIATREVLAGPTIQVIDPKGKVVEEWTSTMDNHIIEGLNTGDAYTLREKVAIEGYVGPSDDYHFTIDETGKITTTGPTATDEEGNTVLLVENTKTGDLKVTNTVYSDSESNADQMFEFTVTLGDQSINGTYGDMTFENGVATFTLKGGQEKTATGLPTTMTYTVTGPDVSGFELSESTGVEGTIGNEASTATFKYIKLIDVSVAIRWNDANNQDGKRPSEVSAILKANDEQVGSKVLNDRNEWSDTFENQPSCTQEGTRIVYSWEMPATADYNTLSETAVDGHNTITILTLTHEPEVTEVKVSIDWDDTEDTENQEGFRPKNVNVKLIANGEVKDGEVTLNADNDWTYNWTRLNKYANGKEIEYTISQEQLVNYNAPVITKGNESEWEYTVTNTICGVIFTNEGNSTTLTLTNPTALQEVSIPTPVDVDHVDIQREFIPETAATVYLPFTIAADNVEGGRFYSFTDVNETKDPWEVSYTEVTDNIAANTPYIFLPDNLHGGKITVNNGENKLSVCTANAQTTHDAERQWEFIGTYQPIKWLSDPEAEGYTAERADEIGSVYGFAASNATVGTTEFTAGQFVKVASGAYIKPYRAYLKRTTTSGARGRNGISSPELPTTMNVVLISANGVTVSVGTINLDCESGDWYSLDGRKLDAQPTKKGMYIHNNKKVIIK